MKIDHKKLARQNEGITKWLYASKYGSHKDRAGTWEWIMSMGKTYGSILLSLRVLADEQPDYGITISAGSEAGKEGWLATIEHVPAYLRPRFKIFTVGEIMEETFPMEHRHTGLLIVDEIHEYLTPDRMELISGNIIQYKDILGLTGTWKDRKGRHKQLHPYCPVVDTITEEEAVREGYISKFIEYNWGIELTPEDKMEYDKVTEVISKEMAKFGKEHGLEIAQRCIAGGKDKNDKWYPAIKWAAMVSYRHGWRDNLNTMIPEEREIEDMWNPGIVINYAKRFMDAVRDRMYILQCNDSKIDAAIALIAKYPKLKTIAFSQSTGFADKLAMMINKKHSSDGFMRFTGVDPCVVYHSQLPTIRKPSPVSGKMIKWGKDRQKAFAIDAIRSGAATIISTASSLDNSFSVEDIRMGIVTSGTSNPKQQKQRKGRVTRLEHIYDAQNVIVFFVNIYFKGTKDEDWLRARQKDSTHTIYWVSSVESINYQPMEKGVHDLSNI